jgi:hypothetical protein
MNLNALEKRLLAEARASAPDERVPYAFEKRIMARLGDSPRFDLAGWWGMALWRGAVPCVAVALLLCAWNLWQGATSSVNGDFPKEFETAVLIASDQPSDTW